MNAPFEILLQVASYLNGNDLKNFHSTSKRCALAGLSSIPRDNVPILSSYHHNSFQVPCNQKQMSINDAGNFCLCSPYCRLETQPTLVSQELEFDFVDT